HAGCTIAGATLVPHFMDRAEAGLRLHGSAPVSLSQRNIVNIQSIGQMTDYAFIDHTKGGGNGWLGTFGSTFTGATPTFGSLLDANGWPNNASANGQSFGGGINVPDPANFGGPYVVDMVGNGTFSLSIQFPLFGINGSGATGAFTISNLV